MGEGGTFLSTCRQASNRRSVPRTRFVRLVFLPCLLEISADHSHVSKVWGLSNTIQPFCSPFLLLLLAAGTP